MLDGSGLNCLCFRWMGQADSTFRSSDICGIRSNSGRWEFSFTSLSFYKRAVTLHNIIHSLLLYGTRINSYVCALSCFAHFLPVLQEYLQLIKVNTRRSVAQILSDFRKI